MKDRDDDFVEADAEGPLTVLGPFLTNEPTGAPHLARFSRDVGFHRFHPHVFRHLQEEQVDSSGLPHLAKNERDMGHPSVFLKDERLTRNSTSPRIPHHKNVILGGAPLTILGPFLTNEPTGAPHLARFSRDVGDHRFHPHVFRHLQEERVDSSGLPHLAKNERDMGHPSVFLKDEGLTRNSTSPRIPHHKNVILSGAPLLGAESKDPELRWSKGSNSIGRTSTVGVLRLRAKKRRCAQDDAFVEADAEGPLTILGPFLTNKPTGAPHLARFSRDVGFHRSHPHVFRHLQEKRVDSSGLPHLAKNERDMGHPSVFLKDEGLTRNSTSPRIPHHKNVILSKAPLLGAETKDPEHAYLAHAALSFSTRKPENRLF